jgi:hypothetical protein
MHRRRKRPDIGSTNDIQVVAQFDNAAQRGTTRYHIQRDGKSETAVPLGRTDSGSPQVLLDFGDGYVSG